MACFKSDFNELVFRNMLNIMGMSGAKELHSCKQHDTQSNKYIILYSAHDNDAMMMMKNVL